MKITLVAIAGIVILLLAFLSIRRIRCRTFLWIMESRPYLWFARNIVPYIRWNMYYTRIRGSRYKAGYEELRAGDILLASDYRKLTTKMIGGDWCHAAICIGNNYKGNPHAFEIAEMTHLGFTRSEAYDVWREADHVIICRCADWDDDYIQNKVIPRILELSALDPDYDFSFTYGIATLYCSELVIDGDVEKRINASDTDDAFLGRRYISPTDILAADNVICVHDSDDIPQQGPRALFVNGKPKHLIRA